MNTDRFISLAITQAIQIAAVLALVAIVTSTLCRRRPRLAYALWLLALIKCITPPVWSSPTGLFSWASARAGAPTTLITSTDAPREITRENPPPPGALPRPERAHPRIATTSKLSLSGTILGVWLAGSLAVGGWTIARFMAFRRRVIGPGTELPRDIANLFNTLRKSMRVRDTVDFHITRLPVGPAVVGILRPMIVIPEELASASHENLRAILAHELVHVRRRDHWIGALQAFVQVIWWPNPLVWWMNHRINQVRELSCDEEVIATLRCDPPSYVQMLLDVIQLRRQPALPVIGVGMRSFDVTRRRMDHLLSADHFSARRSWTTWLIFTVGLLVLLPGAGLAISQSDPATTTPAASAGFVRFDGVVTDFVTKQPIEGAQVTLVRGVYDVEARNNQPANGPSYEGISDAAGKVAIDIPLNDVVKGSYLEIRVHHTKYAPRTAQVAGLWKDGAPRRDPIVKNHLLVLTPGEEITGVLEDPDGKPLPNTKMSIRSIGGDEQTRYLKEPPVLSMDSAVTDERGRFRFNAVKDANFATIWAEPTKFAIVVQDFGNRRGDIGVIRVTRGVDVVGLLVDEAGKPVSGVSVVVESARKGTKTTPTAYRRDAITDAQGQFTIAPLAPGEYRIAPIDNRFVPQVVTLADNMAARTITLRGTELATVRGRLIRAKDAPRNRQPFEMFGGEGDTWFNGHATTDADGNFEFRVPKGLKKVEFNPSSANEGFVYQWKRGENGKLRGGQIKLASLDSDVTDLFMIEQRAGSLTIKPLAPDGNVPTNGIGAEIRYADTDLWQPWGTSWQDKMQRGDVPVEYVNGRKGAVIKQLVPDREFTVTVWASGFEPASQTLKLAEGESREVEIKLTPQGTK